MGKKGDYGAEYATDKNEGGPADNSQDFVGDALLKPVY
jgi:hypothetical protein